MTEIERKALALINEAALNDEPWTLDDVRGGVVFKALCRAIKQHEAFRQEVSDAVEAALSTLDQLVLDDRGEAAARGIRLVMARFIIAKPDPLVEALNEAWDEVGRPAQANRLRAALAARGLKIVEDK